MTPISTSTFRRPILAFSIATAAVALAGCNLPSIPEAPDVEDTAIGLPDFQVDFIDTSDDVGDVPGDTTTSTDVPLPDADVVDEDSTRVGFESGDAIVSLARFSWRTQVPGASSRPRDPVIVPSLKVEYVPAEVADRFDDPRPIIDQPTQNWRVVEYEQADVRAPLTVWYEDPAAPEFGLVRAHFEADESGALRVRVVPEPAEGWGVARIELTFGDDGGPLYGTGLRLDGANGRGTQRALFRDTDPFSSAGTNGVDVVVPWVFNPRGYGVLVDTDAPGVFDLGVDNPFVVQLRFDAQELDTRFFIFDEPATILERYRAEAGLAPAPPGWALAPHFWDPDATAVSILDDVAIMRELDLPLGGVWLPESWQTGYTTHAFNSALFPDPAAFVSELDATGVRAVAWSSPYLDTSDDSDVAPGFGSAAALHDEAAAAGYLALGPDGEPASIAWRPGRLGGLLDPTAPGASAWWQDQARPSLELGLRGYTVARGEDLFVQGPDAARFASGDDAATAQSRLGAWSAAALDQAATSVHGDEALVLSTTAGFGDAPSLNGIWVPTIPTRRENGVGGIESAISAMLSLSTSGYPWVSIPLGGDGPVQLTDDELMRWTGLSVFSPFTEIGHGRRPWSDAYGDSARDVFTELLRLRMRLTPYLERVAAETAAGGLPVVRPMGLAYPGDAEGWTREDQFLLGRDLLVAPRIDERPTRDVYLPDEVWRDWYTGQIYGQRQVVAVQPLAGKVPVFVRNGALVPMRLESAETLVDDVTDPDTTTARSADRTLHVRAAGFPNGELDFADGTGLEVITSAATNTTVLRLTPGDVTQAAYIEFLGVFPQEVNCGEGILQLDDSVALVPVDVATPPGVRLLSTGTLLRMVGDAECELFW